MLITLKWRLSMCFLIWDRGISTQIKSAQSTALVLATHPDLCSHSLSCVLSPSCHPSPLKVHCSDSSLLFWVTVQGHHDSPVWKGISWHPTVVARVQRKPTTQAAHKAFRIWSYLGLQASHPRHMVPSMSHLDEMLLPSDLVFKTQLSHQLPQEDTLCPSEDLVPLLGAPAASKHTCLNTHHKEIQYPFTGQSPPSQDPRWQEWSFVFESSLITWEFSASPVPRTLHFHDKGRGFDPWLGNLDCTCQKERYESSLIINHA